jgi:periplasmic copper chaperone A
MKSGLTMILGLAGALLTTAAHAHVTVASGPAVANQSQDVTFSLAHGCDGADTYALTIEIPAGVTFVRPRPNDFGSPTVATDGSGNVTSVTWDKTDALDADTQYYKFTVHLRTPDQPFTQLLFRAHQSCRAADGTETTVDWIAAPGAAGEPAPVLVILPARLPGWNRYIINGHLTDVTPYFQDAQIVWRGTAVYSFNPNTAAQITMTPGVTSLTGGLHPGDEIWVKY